MSTTLTQLIYIENYMYFIDVLFYFYFSVCFVGLIPVVESNSAEQELYSSFYTFLSSYNTDSMLRLELNKNFNIKISKIHFSFSKDNQWVKAAFVSERSDQIQKLRSHLEDESLSNWLADFLNPFGLNVELEVNFEKKIEIIAFEIEIPENPEER